MVRAGSVITACVVVLSGCAFVDSPQPESESRIEIGVIAQLEPAPVVSESDMSSATSAPAVAPKSFTPDEIRRLQVRLRDVGLDPGPVDGLAGAKTKAAVKRFQSGCAELHGLVDGGQSSASVTPAFNKIPNRQETLALQQQLRSAGFNPGPIDGVFGARMKSVFNHLQNGCPAALEFAAFFDQPADSVSKPLSPAALAERPSASGAIALQSRQEAAKQPSAPVAVRPQEDIRILQLRLRDAGYDPGPFDGVMGPKTKLALQQMQASQRRGKAKNTVTAGIGVQY